MLSLGNRAVAGFVNGVGEAYITINGADYKADWSGASTSQITPANPNNEMAYFNAAPYSLNLTDFQYKSNGEGLLGSSYASSGVTDLQNGDTGTNMNISWVGSGSDYIHHARQILYVKDGNNDPYWYAFDLGATVGGDIGAGWNGQDSISLNDFWTSDGNISHASFFTGGDFSELPEPVIVGVPEPASMGLWLTAAVAGAFYRRRRKTAR